uniref:Uncharacterized protein n=1 Tax=Schizaphis graminum TaxID=13262 RepID=A0A2S2NTM9_SCHGA
MIIKFISIRKVRGHNTLLYIHSTHRKKDLPPLIFIKGLIHFCELRNAFSDLIGPGSLNCKATYTLTHTLRNYRKIINFTNENDAVNLTHINYNLTKHLE